MSADNDAEGQLVSSPEDSDAQTPQAQSTVLSPPDSQHRSAMPTSLSQNANGKRPINTISNGADDSEELAAMHANGKPRQEFPAKTHDRSGYTWNREEDAPGYAWLNKKALDEYHRAWDSLVHKESMVRGEFIYASLGIEDMSSLECLQDAMATHSRWRTRNRLCSTA